MYEKPQYFTTNGFKRMANNPYSDSEAAKQRALLGKKKLLSALKQSQKGQSGATLSDEGAKLIAQVLKSMLNSRRS